MTIFAGQKSFFTENHDMSSLAKARELIIDLAGSSDVCRVG
jgi:hypothetical protein